MTLRQLLGACAAVVGFSTMASAAPITVDPWHSAGNGSATGTNFGGVPNMDILYSGKDAPGNSPDTAQMVVWALWGTLFHVSYTGRPWADIGLRPDVGWTGGISLFSFELGSFLGASVGGEVRVYNFDYSQLLFQQSVNYADSAILFTPNLFSANGLHIQFSNDDANWPIGIDNITVEAGNTVPTVQDAPEPASLGLVALGLAAVAGLRRRAGRNPAAAYRTGRRASPRG